MAVQQASMELSDDTKMALAGETKAHNVKEDALEEYRCAVCKDPAFKTPVITICEHVFHGQCLDRALQGKVDPRCPTCRKSLPAGEGRLRDTPLCVRRTLARARVECPQGCGEVMTFETLNAHVTGSEGCPQTPFRCGNEGCGVVFERRLTAEHLSLCTHALVPCGQCNGQVKRHLLQQHNAEECSHRKVDCPHKCGTTDIVFNTLDKHLREDCTGTVHKNEVVRLREEVAELKTTVSLLLLMVPVSLALDVFVPPTYGHQELCGRYKLLPLKRNGAAVWGKGAAKVYMDKVKCWMVAASESAFEEDRGFLHTKDLKTSPAPFHSDQWQYLKGGKWFPGPEIVISPAQ